MSARPAPPIIPIAAPMLGEEEERAVVEVLRSGRLTSGPYVERFEHAFAGYVGTSHGIATSSGTMALEAGLEALAIGPGDAVATTPFTFVSSTNAVVHRGARLAFADVEPDTYLLDPNRVEDLLRSDRSIGAMLVVHLFGLAADMDAFRDLAARYGVALLEDAAQAHGATYRGRRAGSFGAWGVFSFYPTKNMTTGEGGMITTDDAALAHRLRILVYPESAGPGYEYRAIGYNYRMSEIAAALGVVQLGKLDARNAARRRNAARLDAGLADLAWLETPAVPPERVHVYHQYVVRARDRDGLQRHLDGQGIESRAYYPIPVPHTPAYRELGYGDVHVPVAEALCRDVLALPVHPAMTEEDLERVVNSVRRFAPGGSR